MKKVSMIFVMGMMLTLAACSVASNEPTQGEETIETVSEPSEPILEPIVTVADEFEFHLEIISEEQLAQLENVVTVDYREALWPHDMDNGLLVLFSFNQPVTEFSFVEVAALEAQSVVVSGRDFDIGTIDAEQNLVLTHAIGHHGTLPRSGFHFVDQEGVSHWYSFEQSQKDGEMSWSSMDGSYVIVSATSQETGEAATETNETTGMALPELTKTHYWNDVYHWRLALAKEDLSQELLSSLLDEAFRFQNEQRVWLFIEFPDGTHIRALNDPMKDNWIRIEPYADGVLQMSLENIGLDASLLDGLDQSITN